MRAAARARVGAMSAQEKKRASAAVCERLGAVVGDGVVLAYLADELEPGLDALIERWIGEGRIVVAARCDWESRTFEAVRMQSLGDVEVRRHGVREPASGEVIAPDELGVVLAPGAAFDAGGGRLGRGGGFYDRFFARVPASVRRVGVCFGAQVVDRVPRGGHDALVGCVVTESGVFFSDQNSDGGV